MQMHVDWMLNWAHFKKLNIEIDEPLHLYKTQGLSEVTELKIGECVVYFPFLQLTSLMHPFTTKMCCALNKVP